MSRSSERERLRLFLKALKLPSFASDHEEVAGIATEEGWSYERFLTIHPIMCCQFTLWAPRPLTRSSVTWRWPPRYTSRRVSCT